MSDLRVVGLRFEVDVGDGKTKIVQMRRAISDTTATVDALNRELGDNVKVSVEKVQTDKEVIAQARLIVSQQERQRRKTEQVVQQYARLNETIRQYGNDAETVNAIIRLGSDATEQQKQEVAQLVQEYQRLRNAGDTAGSGFRNLRGVAQNLGWQLQDIAVQAQMGTNWLVILGQQGSQMAAAFGATGALIGAGIAVIAAGMPALIAYLDDAATSTKELEEASKKLNELFDEGKISVGDYSDELVKLYEIDKRLAELKVFTGMVEAEKILKNSREQIVGFVSELKELGEGYRWFNSLQEEFDEDVEDLAKKFGITTDEVLRLNQAYNTVARGGSADDLVNVFKEIATTNPTVTNGFKELALQVSTAAFEAGLAEDKMAKLQAILDNGFIPTTKNASGVIEDQVKKYRQMTAELTMTDREQARFNFLLNETVGLSAEQVTQTLREMDAYYDERDAIEARNKAIKESKRLDDERIKQRNRLLSPIEQSIIVSSGNPVTAEIERHDQIMRDLRDARSMTKQYEFSEHARINKLIEEEEDRHANALFEAQLTLASNQVAIIGSVSDFMSGMADEFATGADRVREQMEEMTAFQKVMFFIQRSIAAAEAVINGISLGAKLAEMFPLAAVPMQTFGTTMGAVNAGAIMGTTFAGAFDNGGYIPSGMTGIVSEYGDELVNGVMVRGPADVTSRVDTAAMMSGGLNVTVENYAPGVTHEVQQIDENTVKIIATKVFNENIDRGVSGVLGKKGTKSNKTLTNNYDVRGRV